jgi:[ribosomal protein S5]-alanine N-acetyltransferase
MAMATIPVLETPRLRLRPFTSADAPTVEQLAGAFAIADTTLNIPHPYPAGAAAQWIATHSDSATRGVAFTWAITDRLSADLCGAIGLHVNLHHQHAEIGYWLGVPFWGRGYTTEAAQAVLAYGFTTLGLERIVAHHFTRNPASGRVMQKIGMASEGLLRRHYRKGDRYEDIICYGILREEWEALER